MKRCDQLSRRYDADVYLLVRRKQRHYDYKSTDDPSFPVSSPDLVSCQTFTVPYPILINDPKEKLYPPVIRKTALDYTKRNLAMEAIGSDGKGTELREVIT
jgi:hypothetical protein